MPGTAGMVVNPMNPLKLLKNRINLHWKYSRSLS